MPDNVVEGNFPGPPDPLLEGFLAAFKDAQAHPSHHSYRGEFAAMLAATLDPSIVLMPELQVTKDRLIAAMKSEDIMAGILYFKKNEGEIEGKKGE